MVVPQNPVVQASIFATGNGVPSTTGVNVVYNQSVGSATLDLLPVSPSTGLANFALDGAICHRNLVEGRDIVTGNGLAGEAKKASERVRKGIEDVQLTARLGDLPAIVVQGRSDTLVPVNHASRAYCAKDQSIEGKKSQLRYFEVTNAQHFDAFLPAGLTSGYDTRFVPLHVYLIRALDWMCEHLTSSKPLPPSRVVRGVPRGGLPGLAPPIPLANVPPIAENPAAGDRIVFAHDTLFVPE